MCFSKRESLLALIVGTALNVLTVGVLLSEKRYAVDWQMRIATVLLWQYALLMQIPEAAQWHYIDNNKPTPKWIKPTAYVFNNTQPIVPWIIIALTAFYTGRRVPWWSSIAPIVFTVVAAALFKSEVVNTSHKGITPVTNCPHLSLHWWQGKLKCWLPLYFLGVLSVLAVLDNKVQKGVQVTIFVASFLASYFFYKCGSGSVWCWLIAPAGLAALI